MCDVIPQVSLSILPQNFTNLRVVCDLNIHVQYFEFGLVCANFFFLACFPRLFVIYSVA